jgi:DNA transposition AAA+ family ATPase
MAPELYGTMEVQELQDLAGKVQEFQNARKLSDAALAKMLPSIGSTKTYKRILGGDLKELDLENQLHGYRSAVAFIESMGEDDSQEEELYEDLYPVIHLRRAFFETTRERGIARVIFLLGPNGSGKSSARKLLIEKFGQRLITIEANVAWNDSPQAMLGALLAQFGKKDVPFTDRLTIAIEQLSRSRRCLCIEEAHHLGPRCLNLVKTLINQTPAEVILIAIDTLWRKLETRAYEEATQLTGNRHADTIRLGSSVRDSDVRKLLERRIPSLNGDIKQAVRLVAEKANAGGMRHGLYAFVREVCKKANEKAGKDDVTLEILVNAVAEEAASR